MQIWLIILAVFLTILILLLIIPIELKVIYDSQEIEEKASVLIKYAFIKYRIYPKQKNIKKTTQADVDAEEEKEKEPFSFEKKKEELEKYIHIFKLVKRDVIRILSYASKHAVVFDRIEIKSEFGFDDAMHTGIFTGIYNGFVYSIIGVIHHNSNLKEMEVNLQPVFGKKCFNNHFSCILHIKTVHIIIVAYNVLRLYRKIKNEGRR
ncbi:MAG: DUF2953 domain-containing protein [Firmicutes bacterium]|nr:DUF2953 domain-containing protein [Bacillota bacterium]